MTSNDYRNQSEPSTCVKHGGGSTVLQGTDNGQGFCKLKPS